MEIEAARAALQTARDAHTAAAAKAEGLRATAAPLAAAHDEAVAKTRATYEAIMTAHGQIEEAEQEMHAAEATVHAAQRHLDNLLAIERHAAEAAAEGNGQA